MVIRLGKRQGFRTINLVRRAEVAEELRALGADEVIDTGSEDLIARVASITANSGVRYALDCVGADTLALMLRCLAPGAHLVCYGSLGGDALNFPVRDLMSPAARIEGFLLPQWIAGQSLLGRLRATRRFGRLIADGILSSEVGQTYPLERRAPAPVVAARCCWRSELRVQRFVLDTLPLAALRRVFARLLPPITAPGALPRKSHLPSSTPLWRRML